jgi:hypothetical protein
MRQSALGRMFGTARRGVERGVTGLVAGHAVKNTSLQKY